MEDLLLQLLGHGSRWDSRGFERPAGEALPARRLGLSQDASQVWFWMTEAPFPSGAKGWFASLPGECVSSEAESRQACPFF